MQYRYVAPSSHFVRNGVSLDFRVASLLKIQFACTTPFGELPRWGAKNVLSLFASLAKEERAVRASLRSGIAGREMAWGGKEPHLPIVENGCMPYTYYVGDR